MRKTWKGAAFGVGVALLVGCGPARVHLMD